MKLHSNGEYVISIWQRHFETYNNTCCLLYDKSWNDYFQFPLPFYPLSSSQTPPDRYKHRQSRIKNLHSIYLTHLQSSFDGINGVQSCFYSNTSNTSSNATICNIHKHVIQHNNIHSRRQQQYMIRCNLRSVWDPMPDLK